MMQSTLQKSGPSPYALSVMTGILLVAVTAYPKSLDESVARAEKKEAVVKHSKPSAAASLTKTHN